MHFPHLFFRMFKNKSINSLKPILLSNRKESGFNETAARKVFASMDVMIQFLPFNETNELLEFRRIMVHFNWTVEYLYRKLMQPCDRMLKKCLWLNEIVPCDRLFHVSKSAQGFCCSFNYNEDHKYTLGSNDSIK